MVESGVPLYFDVYFGQKVAFHLGPGHCRTLAPFPSFPKLILVSLRFALLETGTQNGTAMTRNRYERHLSETERTAIGTSEWSTSGHMCIMYVGHRAPLNPTLAKMITVDWNEPQQSEKKG